MSHFSSLAEYHEHEAAMRVVEEAAAPGAWTPPGVDHISLPHESTLVITERLSGTGAAPAVAPAEPAASVMPPKAMPMSDEALRAEWARSAGLRREFSTAGTYVAYQKAADGGQAKILTGVTVAPIASAESSREGLMAEWSRTPALRAEFRTAGAYASFVEAERAGRARIVTGRGVTKFTAADFTS